MTEHEASQAGDVFKNHFPQGYFLKHLLTQQTTKAHKTVFKAAPDLHFIFLVVPSYMSLGSTLVTIFEPVGIVPCFSFDEEFSVHVCHRHHHCPQLYIRQARVEDHDDLMPIFMHHDTSLREIYGEYFLAELIEAQDEENYCVICEVRSSVPFFGKLFWTGPDSGQSPQISLVHYWGGKGKHS
uniref:Cilia- and flagella-associated protein 61 N-terminal domain-containing protein n=1 Tax=Vombatus ursinus TaxID=29139 RepID=A0A4X2K6N3_VOMUR